MKLIVAGTILTALIFGGFWIHNHGLSTAGFQRAFASQAQEKLEEELKRKEAENNELRADKARSERSLQMSETAVQELERELKKMALENERLRDEANFFRNIISPPDKKGGVRVQNLYVEPTGTADTYRYKLVLIQALKHDSIVTGLVSFDISGSDGNQDRVITVPSKDHPIKATFKYFQDLEGQFELPKDFKAHSIKVTVTPAGGAPIQVSGDFPTAGGAVQLTQRSQ